MKRKCLLLNSGYIYFIFIFIFLNQHVGKAISNRVLFLANADMKEMAPNNKQSFHQKKKFF